MIADAQGTVLAVHTTPANVRDDQAVAALLGRLTGGRGPLRPPASLHGDAGYGFPHTARQVAAAGVEPVLAARASPGPRPPGITPARRGNGDASGLGAIRWVVEQTLALLGHFRRIKVCYERTGAHFQAFHDLAATLLCFTRLQHYTGGL